MTTYEITEFQNNNVEVCNLTYGSLTKVSARHERLTRTEYGINKVYSDGLTIELDVYFTDYETAFNYLLTNR